MTESGPRPPVSSRTSSRGRRARRGRSLDAVPAARSSRSGTRSIAEHALGAAVLRDPAGTSRRSARGRARATAAAVGDLGVLDGLPGGGQHVGQVDEAVVGRPLRDLDRAEVRLRHAQELGLPARAPGRRAWCSRRARRRCLLAHLRRLALRLQLVLAHEAVAAGDVERDDDAVARGDVRDLGADLLDDAHRLVAEDVALVDERAEHLVEVKVGAADARSR